MTSTSATMVSLPRVRIDTTGAWARLLLMVMNVVAVGIAVIYTVLPAGSPYGSFPAALVPIAAAMAVIGLQLRHSLPAAAGRRPLAATATLVMLAVLVYAPLPWFGGGWGITQSALIASALILLRPPARTVATLAVITASCIHLLDIYAAVPLAHQVYNVGAGLLFDTVVGVSLYGAVRLTQALDQLAAARTELAAIELGRERLRVSRDLHDLLGQSLSAVSLKGELALRLIPTDPPAARAEIDSLAGVARHALDGIGRVVHDEHQVSLAGEVDGAQALLSTADVSAHIDIALDSLPPAPQEALAWAVREGVTNLLRHSRATICTIQARDHAGWWSLDIVNDGAPTRPHHSGEGGHGLTGLAVRASALGGTVTTDHTDGQFRLHLTIPKRCP